MSLDVYVQIAVILGVFITGMGTLITGMIFLRGSLRDIRGEVQAVHTKIEGVRTELKKDIEAVQQQVAGQGERLARIEGMLTPPNGRYSAQEEAVSAEQSLPPQPRAARSA